MPSLKSRLARAAARLIAFKRSLDDAVWFLAGGSVLMLTELHLREVQRCSREIRRLKRLQTAQRRPRAPQFTVRVAADRPVEEMKRLVAAEVEASLADHARRFRSNLLARG